MATELKLTGVDELLAELARLAPDLTAEASTLERTIAEQTAEQLRAALPVVTGRLRASVQVQRESSTSPARVFTRIAVTAPYAEHVEYGTHRTPPRPVFVPITRRGREAFAKAVSAAVKATGLKVTGELRNG
jgi:HK97 gp10 family phage protein